MQIANRYCLLGEKNFPTSDRPPATWTLIESSSQQTEIGTRKKTRRYSRRGGSHRSAVVAQVVNCAVSTAIHTVVRQSESSECQGPGAAAFDPMRVTSSSMIWAGGGAPS